MTRLVQFLNMSSFKDRINRSVWTVDSVEHPAWKPYYFLFMEQPLKELGYELSLRNFEDIDKTQTWFIPLNVNQGPWDYVADNLWTDFPPELLHELVHGNAKLIANNENEYDSYYVFSVFYKMFYKDTRVSPKKIILLTPAAHGKKNFNQWVRQNAVPQDDLITVEYSPHIDLTFNDGIIKLTEFELKKNRSKKFTCLNRAFRWHRPMLVALMANNNVLDRGYVSLGTTPNDDDLAHKNGGWKSWLLRKTIEFPWEQKPSHWRIKSKLAKGIAEIYNKIPMIVDKTEFITNYADWMSTPVDHLRDSYFSVVTSTHFFQWQEESPGWNEKEWKPMLAKQPFIIVNRPHILAQMRRFGFLTFDKWIDESYDDIEDDWERLDFISNEIQRLSSISNDDWDKMIEEMSHILEYNRKVIIEKRWTNIFYASDLKNLLTYI